MTHEQNDEPKNQIRQLRRVQRRVLGSLMEKAFTTPEQYPLTLKAATTACNQKSNRDPVVSYSESQVQDALDQMREDLLVAEVFTDGGRAARYRHYMRHKFDFSEVQFAIIAELLLRGRQQPGELRTRASRMVRIDSQEQLREALADLQQKGFIQTSGPLERRGVEVDHTFYLPDERQVLGEMPDSEEPAEAERTPTVVSPTASGSVHAEPPVAGGQAPRSALAVTGAGIPHDLLLQLELRLREQNELIRNLQSAINELEDRLQRMERELGL